MAQQAEIPKIILEPAPPFEQGRRYGQLAADRIARCVELYLADFGKKAGLKLADVRDAARRFLRAVEQAVPTITTELKGIAEGAGQPLEDILAINFRTELLYGFSAPVPSDGCTTIGLLREATANGHVLMAKNWDWQVSRRDVLVVLEVQRDTGVDMLILVEAGMLARDGLNSNGIAVLGNMLQSDRDGKTREGLPIPIIRRQILESKSFSDALAAVLRAKRTFSGNYLLGHRDNVIIDLEASPEEVFTLYPQRGLLVHANHFKGHHGVIRDTGVTRMVDSLYRDYRVEQHLAPKVGRIGVDDIRRALTDHFGEPFAVCRHYAQRPGDVGPTMTAASMIIDLTTGEFFVALGPPCQHEYVRHTFSRDVYAKSA